MNTLAERWAHFTDPNEDDRNGVILTSYRREGRLGRLSRLHSALNLFAPATAQKIARLHDHKGLLTIYWLVRPSYKDRLICGIVWGSPIAGEQEEHVEHLLYVASQL